MRIAQIAPTYDAVRPTHDGGTERVVGSRCEELVHAATAQRFSSRTMCAGYEQVYTRLLTTAPGDT